MDIKSILSICDHTLLAVDGGWNAVRDLIDDAIHYKTASVCIPPCYVAKASEYAMGLMPICTVIGFPNGYNSQEAKVFETAKACEEGADEIDMVINVGALKEGRNDYVAREIERVRSACPGKILKVIVETCLLSEKEKIEMCRIVSSSGADFIKTSTGFSTGGATVEDVKLFKANVSAHVKIKAAGGIKTLEDAQALIDAGAARLGTSRIVKIVKSEKIL